MKSKEFPFLFLAILSTGSLTAQEKIQVLKHIAYNDKDPAQILDVYPAKSEQPAPVMIHIHGDGWRDGDYASTPTW